jgi:hypothetical protein
LRIEEIFLAKIRKYDRLTGAADGARYCRKANGREWSEERFFCPGGHDNRLKRLISDEEIKGNPSLFLGIIWLKLGPAWPDLGKFGFGLDKLS